MGMATIISSSTIIALQYVFREHCDQYPSRRLEILVPTGVPSETGTSPCRHDVATARKSSYIYIYIYIYIYKERERVIIVFSI